MEMFILINGLLLFVAILVLVFKINEKHPFSIKGGVVFIIGILNYILLRLFIELIPFSLFWQFPNGDLPFNIAFWKLVFILFLGVICLLILFYLVVVIERKVNTSLSYWKLCWSNIVIIVIFGILMYDVENPLWDSYSYQKKDIILLDYFEDPLTNNFHGEKYFISRSDLIATNLWLKDGSTGLYFGNYELQVNCNVLTTNFNPTFFDLKYENDVKANMYESYCIYEQSAICRGYKPNDELKINFNFWKSSLYVLTFLFEIFLSSFSKGIINSILLLMLFFFKEDYYFS